MLSKKACKVTKFRAHTQIKISNVTENGRFSLKNKKKSAKTCTSEKVFVSLHAHFVQKRKNN